MTTSKRADNSGRTLVIIATLNEALNICFLIESILSEAPQIDVLVVDDNSPDGTAEVVKSLQQRIKQVFLLTRAHCEGLGPAIMDGLKWAIDQNYGTVINMDGDLSHRAADIPMLLRIDRACDLVIGSRFVTGGVCSQRAIHRRLLSLVAGHVVRTITGMPFCDPTSGFRCFSQGAVEEIMRNRPCSLGYSFHIECLHRVWSAGLLIKEVPIHFLDRKRGRSKLNMGIVLEAARRTWSLRHVA